jgi:hypothetical protein
MKHPPLRLTAVPCPRCLGLAKEGTLAIEMIQPLPEGVWAPLARDGSGKCCVDCGAADALTPRLVPTFEMARLAVGNDRREQLRLPGAPLGLVGAGFMRPSEEGDLEKHLAWLEENNWFGEREHV